MLSRRTICIEDCDGRTHATIGVHIDCLNGNNNLPATVFAFFFIIGVLVVLSSIIAGTIVTENQPTWIDKS